MKPLSEQDHYEILEAPRDAADAELDRAYRLALATYADDSLAGYSIFGEGDAAVVRERIETAYRVLRDPTTRRAYDASLAFAAAPSRAAPSLPVPEKLPMDELEELDDEEEAYDGARLRRTRLRLGLELDDIAAITKINPSYLGFLEEERFQALPAPVYVRGFVTALAACLGLDARRVADSYMERYDSLRATTRKPR